MACCGDGVEVVRRQTNHQSDPVPIPVPPHMCVCMQVGVSLALSVIPEGLVAIVTLTMGAFGCGLCVVVYLCFYFVCCVVMHCAGRLATINIH